jgi:hypothetical protein
MNPIVLLWMSVIAAVWIAVGYEAVHLGAWLGLGLYVLALIAATNPRLWWRW